MAHILNRYIKLSAYRCTKCTEYIYIVIDLTELKFCMIIIIHYFVSSNI